MYYFYSTLFYFPTNQKTRNLIQLVNITYHSSVMLWNGISIDVLLQNTVDI